MQCLYDLLTPYATKPDYIQNITFTIEEHTVYERVDYRSVANETSLIQIFVLTIVTEQPTVDFCNKLWITLTPDFYVHLDRESLCAYFDSYSRGSSGNVLLFSHLLCPNFEICFFYHQHDPGSKSGEKGKDLCPL